MTKLTDSINNLKKQKIKAEIDDRINQFKTLGTKSNEELFKELSYCLLTANFQAAKSIMMQQEIGNDFIRLPKTALAKRLKQLGHRFPNARASYIVEARKYKNSLKTILGKSGKVNSEKINNESEIREWLVNNVKGFGYKEASHFMRNIGFENVAILDFHIIDLMTENGFLKPSKTKIALTKTKYLELENVLRQLGREVNLNLAELDLYLWYLETGNVLK